MVVVVQRLVVLVVVVIVRVLALVVDFREVMMTSPTVGCGGWADKQTDFLTYTLILLVLLAS